MKVWVVTYRKLAATPTVTVWDNYESAEKHFSFLRNNEGSWVTLDEAPVYHVFEVTKDGEEEN